MTTERYSPLRALANLTTLSPRSFGSSGWEAAGPILKSFREWTLAPRAVLIAITALAAILRLLFLNKSLWLDEGASVAIARGIAGDNPSGTWTSFANLLWSRELNMAVYYVLLRLWLHVGTSETFIRLLSVLPGVATVPVVYGIGKRLFSTKAGLTAALLLSVHGAHLGYSQEARGYALVVLLCSVSYLAFVNAVERPAKRYWLLYIVVAVLAIYTHFYAVLMLAAQLISLLWLLKSERSSRDAFISAAVIMALATPAAVFVLTKNIGQLSWITSTWNRLPNLLAVLAGNAVAAPVYLFLWGIALRSTSTGWFRTRSIFAWRSALAVTWLVIPIILVVPGCLIRPVMAPRFLLFCVPAGTLVAAWGLFELREFWRRRLCVAVLVLSMAGVAYTYARRTEDWRAASQEVFTHAKPGDEVTVTPAWCRWSFEYYWSRTAAPGVTYSVSQTQDPKEWAEQAAARHPRLWLLVYSKRGQADPESVRLHEALATSYRLKESRKLNVGYLEMYSASPH
jgi:mannosyltransferase